MNRLSGPSNNVRSDLLDGNCDEHHPRSLTLAVLLSIVYLCRVFGAAATIYYIQGQDFLILWLPCFILSSFYPLVKSFKILGKLVLASAVASVLLPAWISSGGKIERREPLILLGLFTFFWIFYIDVLYKAMVNMHRASEVD